MEFSDGAWLDVSRLFRDSDAGRTWSDRAIASTGGLLACGYLRFLLARATLQRIAPVSDQRTRGIDGLVHVRSRGLRSSALCRCLRPLPGFGRGAGHNFVWLAGPLRHALAGDSVLYGNHRTPS